MARNRLRIPLLALALSIAPALAAADTGNDPLGELEDRIAALDEATPGHLGVYIKRMSDGQVVAHEADRPWYLASTTKVPVAVAVLQRVEQGQLSLDTKLTLEESDYVDGSGRLLWIDPGATFTVGELLEEMLVHSDSTAADMLIRLLGEDDLNKQIRTRMVENGFGTLTTILQVRYDAYAELHTGVTRLDNMDFVRLKNAAPGPDRLEALRKTLDVPPEELRLPSIEAAFENYYERKRNSGTLTAFGRLLERLVGGELLSPPNTQRLLGWMEAMDTGEHRIKAGLPADVRFAQKTGTQLARICNVGVIRSTPGPDSGDDGDRSIVIAACMEKFPDFDQAEATLARVGEAVAETLLQAENKTAGWKK